MSLYTRHGDEGETGLLGHRRVSKGDPLIEAIGDVDELNAWLGLIVTECGDPSLRSLLIACQRDLFEVGAELASFGDQPRLRQERVFWLEKAIDDLTANVPPLKHFILPGGHRVAACCHIARAVARRAERSVVRLPGGAAARPVLCAYLNRLSDLLFAAARWLNHKTGTAEPQWSGDDA
ncbi:MAG TPA: cob(I)yrinic acid a,c-diamide adenosyltransferase [Limnochordia bacterium]|nr:cob(I)yrinic acid a,c-diamide adenosyltransferase [Limnochordia bacterium]